MGTRGLKVFRFRKRHYTCFNQYDSYPEGLGKQLVSEVPTDPDKYKEWLDSMRKTLGEWEEEYQNFLERNPHDSSIQVQMPTFMNDAEHHPAYLAPINDIWIEWVYTIDLDEEVFTVNNSAHFRLDCIPRDDQWIKALATGPSGEKFVLPGKVPVECLADLLVENHIPNTRETPYSSKVKDSLYVLAISDTHT